MNEAVPQVETVATSNSVIPNRSSLFKCEDESSEKRERCSKLLTPTIFHEEWWLDAATGGNFDVTEVHIGGQTVGRLPFSVTKRCGLRMIRMPALTYFLGPAVDEGEGGSNTRFLKRLRITRELIEKLPRVSWQYEKCHAGTTDVIAFQELGFRTYVQFTHEIAPDSEETLWQQMRNKTRNMIRKAEERFAVTELTDPEEFVHLFEQNLASKRLESGIDHAICRKIIFASLERKRGRILVARDNQKKIVAGSFFVWDATSTFYSLCTRCENSGNSASSLLLWESIRESARKGLVFDFAGLGTKGSVLLYSGFGGSVKVRFVAVRSHGVARVLNELRSLSTRENYFY
jgi:Acetyltransferase (GNAT) domain